MFKILIILFTLFPLLNHAVLKVGIGKTDITPPIGTPSAGYKDRKGMEGIHDPLLAIALFIDNGNKQVVFCSVDHLGFTYEMVQEVIQQVHQLPPLKDCEIFIGSSHTHSGGGAYLNIPIIGESLAGPYQADIKNFYVEQTAEAIIQSSKMMVPAKIGIGYGKAANLSKYRASWPLDATPLPDVTVIKITKLDETPFAVIFNYAVHPTALNRQNLLFSSDFIGYARDHLQNLLGQDVQPIYFNGAQGDIIPLIFNEENRFASCAILGQSLAETVATIYKETKVANSLDTKNIHHSYCFNPQATPAGLSLSLDQYKSEMNLIILNKTHAFITIPGELSSIYDKHLKSIGRKYGYTQVSILGLTNDAHGYIILPEAWKNKTFESNLSFGGENYGEFINSQIEAMLEENAPRYRRLKDYK